MVINNQIEVLRRISDIADSAGVANQIDRKHRRIVMAFTLEPGRTHIIYVHPSDEAPTGRSTVTVSSPCTLFESGSRPSEVKDRELGTIFVSGCQLSASYEVLDANEHRMVVASLTHTLESLGENELLKSLTCVSIAAENYEERFGPREA